MLVVYHHLAVYFKSASDSRIHRLFVFFPGVGVWGGGEGSTSGWGYYSCNSHYSLNPHSRPWSRSADLQTDSGLRA